MEKVDFLKANWKTAIISGIVMALASMLAEEFLAIIFIPVMLWGVMGIRQAIEHFREFRRREVLFEIYGSDFRNFYLPGWGRMLLCFCSVAITVIVLQLLGLGPAD